MKIFKLLFVCLFVTQALANEPQKDPFQENKKYTMHKKKDGSYVFRTTAVHKTSRGVEYTISSDSDTPPEGFEVVPETNAELCIRLFKSAAIGLGITFLGYGIVGEFEKNALKGIKSNEDLSDDDKKKACKEKKAQFSQITTIMGTLSTTQLLLLWKIYERGRDVKLVPKDKK